MIELRPAMTRRGLIIAGLASAARSASSVQIEQDGMFLKECSIPGETRADGVFPAHPNGVRLSKDRFLLIYATRGLRGVDEDRSIIYQLRVGSFTGRVIKENLLARAIDNWDPFGNGQLYRKGHGAPTVFGLPKGAKLGGRVPRHANLFVAKWYHVGRAFAEPGRLYKATQTPDLIKRTLDVESFQFRLNDAEDDIEILQRPAPLRQKGYEHAQAKCSAVPAGDMNQSYVNPVPFNRDLTEWIDFHQFGWSDPHSPGGNRVAAVKFRYSKKLHRYEWIETGPILFYPEYPAIEASTVRLDHSWAIAARPQRRGLPILWLRMEDPFSQVRNHVLAETSEQHPPCSVPMSIYRCADGVIRLLSGDAQDSPYREPRNPLYCWKVEPDHGFALVNRVPVIDLLRAGLPIRPEAGPVADMAKVLPHSGGREQLILHRVRTTAIGVLHSDRMLATKAEISVHGIYSAKLIYEQSYPDPWNF